MFSEPWDGKVASSGCWAKGRGVGENLDLLGSMDALSREELRGGWHESIESRQRLLEAFERDEALELFPPQMCPAPTKRPMTDVAISCICKRKIFDQSAPRIARHFLLVESIDFQSTRRNKKRIIAKGNIIKDAS